MAIQYHMRAFNTTLVRYVDWVVNDVPDSTGVYSGYPINQLINITVNRIVQSKVENFLKSNQSLGGTDGYFFHVNSYDWRNATSPISPPDEYVGFAVERGISAVVSISGASNSSPIEITTSSNHNLVTGQLVTIIGVGGNTNANGTWPIVVTGITTFTMTGSQGNGLYTSGGNVYLPTDMSTLIWDEVEQLWRFVYNTNGDGTTLGASQDVKVNNFFVDGFISIGPDPADTGAIRLSNDEYIFSESNPSGTDIQVIGVDPFNRIKLGSLTTDTVYTPGVIVVDGYVQHDGTGNDTPSIGFIREKNDTTIVAFRRADLGADIAALSSNSGNHIILGDAVNSGIDYNTSTGSIHQFQVNSIADFEIGNTFARFTSTVLAPTIYQTDTPNGGQTGQTLLIHAQGGGPGTSTGGNLTLRSGIGQGGSGVHGSVVVNVGNETPTITSKAIFYPTLNAGANSNSILFTSNLLRFATNDANANQVTPRIRQDDTTTSSATGQIFTVQSQNATGTGSAGGVLNLTSGTGTTISGRVNIQTGGVTQIIVSPDTILPSDPSNGPPTTGTVIIKGNLEVQGTTTTVESTVVDIVGSVIHANWTDPISSPNVSPNGQNTGYSVHRGNALGIPRDGAAWIWTENPDGYSYSGHDGYWRAATIPGDGLGADNLFNISNSLNSLGVLSKDFVASTDPNPILGYVAASGSLRTANNVPVAVSRNITATTTLTEAGLTNGSASLPLTPITVVDTTAFTTSGTLLIQSSTGTQTVTYTGKTGTSFTGVVGGTGTIVTDGIVAQTNNSTIFNGVNGTSVPVGTIDVVSTVGFPPSGTLRVVTQTSNVATAAVSVQNITYTGTTATSFTGCLGGTGFLYSGDTVTSTPSPGTLDLVLLGTDFGNRILHGFPDNNTGHIFNTPSGFIYDFQVNNVSQVQLAAGDVDSDGFTESIAIAPTVINPKVLQYTLPNIGASNGYDMMLKAQNGQQQDGVNVNNDGGTLILSSGTAGTGGAGAAGIDGYVDIWTGDTLKVRVFPTDATPVGASDDDNSIIYFESLFRVDSAETGSGLLVGTGVRFRQDDTAGATGQVYTIQAQNAVTTGGNLVLTSGTGTTAGNVQLQTGAVDRVVVHPTFTEFRDTAEALRITPVSAGTTQITYASTVTAAQINQTLTAATPSAPMTIQSQETTAASGAGGDLSLIAGNATGTTSTGGDLNLASGSGTTINGFINFQPGGVTQVLITPTGQFIQWVSTVTSPTLNQATTGGATGQALTVQAQNAATTGGNAVITSGTGATTAGNVQLQTGAIDRVVVHPTFTEFRDTDEAYRITPVSTGTTTLEATSTVLAVTYRQADLTAASGTGATTTVQAQNETGTTSVGGALVLTSGTGTLLDGYVHLQTGSIDKIIIHPDFVEFRDISEAYRIVPDSSGDVILEAIDTATSVNYRQSDTANTTGASTTVQAQNATMAGGNLFLTSGSGATTDGYVALQNAGSTIASAISNKFAFNQGWRRNVTEITDTYQVLVTDDYLAITDLPAPFTVTLPASPTIGDTYLLKDATGEAGINTVTVDGNGNNIDGSSSFVLNAAYAAATFTFIGAEWSVS